MMQIASNRQFFARAILFLSLCRLAMPSDAAELSVEVTDRSGAAIENAVIYAEPLTGEVKLKANHAAEISQRNRQFVPLVTVVQVGSQISFPNYDSIKHHVYSFSPAKSFDQPLYSGKAAEPQLFDKVGTVVLGCNIHDKMIAYVQVVNTPYFGKSDAAGNVRLEGLPAGKYTLKAWHFNLPPLEQVVSQPLSVAEGRNTAMVQLNLIKKAS